MMMMKIRFGAAVLTVASGMKFDTSKLDPKEEKRRYKARKAEKNRLAELQEACASMETVIDEARNEHHKTQFDVHVVNVEEINLPWEKKFVDALSMGTCPKFHEYKWANMHLTSVYICDGCESEVKGSELPFYCGECIYGLCRDCHGPRKASIKNVFHGTSAIDEIMKNGFDISKVRCDAGSAALLGVGHYAAKCFEHAHPKYTKRIGDIRGQESHLTGRFEILVCDIFVPGPKFLGDATNLRLRKVPQFSPSVTCIQGSFELFTMKSWPYYCVASNYHIYPKCKVTYQYQYRDGVMPDTIVKHKRGPLDLKFPLFEPLASKPKDL